MANDETIFREVDQELAEDKLWTDIRRRGPLLVGLALAIVLAVAIAQFLALRKSSIENDAARAYSDVRATVGEGSDDAAPALELFVDEAPDGYGALARFQLAALLASEGENERALAQYRTIYGNDGLPKTVRDLARVRAAHLSVDTGRDAVIADIGDLDTEQTPLARYAREILAIAALDAGDYETAEATFRQLIADTASPSPLKARAEEFAVLASEAKAGIDISWPEGAGRTTVDDLIGALGPSASGLSDLINAGDDTDNGGDARDPELGGDVTDAINDALNGSLDAAGSASPADDVPGDNTPADDDDAQTSAESSPESGEADAATNATGEPVGADDSKEGQE